MWGVNVHRAHLSCSASFLKMFNSEQKDPFSFCVSSLFSAFHSCHTREKSFICTFDSGHSNSCLCVSHLDCFFHH